MRAIGTCSKQQLRIRRQAALEAAGIDFIELA
jgi:hypothetical protein